MESIEPVLHALRKSETSMPRTLNCYRYHVAVERTSAIKQKLKHTPDEGGLLP
jgi:hypothetical protein